MSVIQRIRDKGAWIVFGIIALALIAFILQDGVRRGGPSFSNSSVIGKINGEKIERGEFEEKLQLLEQMYNGQGGPREQMIGTLWNQEVERVALVQEFNKLGLQVSPKELSEILFGDNSPLRQEFTDPATGLFKVNEAKQAFAQLKKSKNAEQVKMINNVYIIPTIQQTLRNKYQNLLMQAAYVPKWMVEKQLADNNAVANMSYVLMPYSNISDSLVKVTDDDIAAYIKKHSNEFQKTEETRSINYVSISAAPSAADSASALNQLLALKNEFATTTEPEVFLTRAGSEVPFYNGYFSKSRMQQANKDSLVKIPVGGLMGPYIDGQTYVIAKMIGTKQWPDSASVRHILVGTVDPRSQQQIRPDSAAKRLIDSIETAIKGGADFGALVTKYSDDQGSKEKGGVYEYFAQGQMVGAFNDFSFDKPIGSKGVVKTDFGYHYMEVIGQKNPAPAYKIAYLSKPIVASSETLSAASTAAAQFAVSSKGGKQFNANAQKENRVVATANEIKQNDFAVSGIGLNRSLVRWAYEHGVGDVSDPIEINDNYIVAIVSAVNKAGLSSPAEARATVEGIVRNEKKAKLIIETKFKGNTLEAYAASTGTQVSRADSINFGAPFIAGIGAESRIVGAAFNKSLLGKVSNPIEGSSGVFAIRAESVGAKASSMDAATLKQNLLQSTRMVSYRGLEALKKAADVTDNRAKFY